MLVVGCGVNLGITLDWHMQQLVDNDEFLKRLTALFESTRTNGGTAVWLSHKRFRYEEDLEMKGPEGEQTSDDREYPVLLRATNGGDINISTRVLPSALHTFHAAYGALLKLSFTAMKKRDKKKEKQRAEELAARRKKLYENLIKVLGPKRGKGRRKRQRLAKAALKQEEARKKLEKKGAQKAKTTPS